MQKSAFITLMKEHRFRNESDLAAVSRLAASYPWCAALQVLQAVGAKQFDTLDAGADINRAAVYIGDRTKLYEYTARRRPPVERPSPEEKTADPAPSATTAQAETKSETAVPEGAAEFSEHYFGERHSEEPDPLEVQILSAAAVQMGEMAAAEVPDDISLQEEEELQSRPESPDDSGSEPDDYGAFAKWLRKLDGEEAEEKPVRKSNLPADDILEKFIAQSPQIAPAKASFFSPARMGKMSLVEDETFVTETLAKIYEKQQDFKKAARAYARLGLKYPEKSTYFATLQKQAEAKIK